MPGESERVRRRNANLQFCPDERSTIEPGSLGNRSDPQPGVVQEQYPRTAMCVRNVDVHVSCSSQVDAQLAAFFIDPRAK